MEFMESCIWDTYPMRGPDGTVIDQGFPMSRPVEGPFPKAYHPDGVVDWTRLKMASVLEGEFNTYGLRQLAENPNEVIVT